jgi:hypothetical protein
LRQQLWVSVTWIWDFSDKHLEDNIDVIRLGPGTIVRERSKKEIDDDEEWPR